MKSIGNQPEMRRWRRLLDDVILNKRAVMLRTVEASACDTSFGEPGYMANRITDRFI